MWFCYFLTVQIDQIAKTSLPSLLLSVLVVVLSQRRKTEKPEELWAHVWIFFSNFYSLFCPMSLSSRLLFSTQPKTFQRKWWNLLYLVFHVFTSYLSLSLWFLLCLCGKCINCIKNCIKKDVFIFFASNVTVNK